MFKLTATFDLSTKKRDLFLAAVASANNYIGLSGNKHIFFSQAIQYRMC